MPTFTTGGSTAPNQPEYINHYPSDGPGIANQIITTDPIQHPYMPSPDSCDGVNNIDWTFVTVPLIVGPATLLVFDQLVVLPRTSKKLILANLGPVQPVMNAAYYFHLKPCNRKDTATIASVLQPNGTESWLEIRNNTVNSTSIFIQGWTVCFRNPIDRFYLSYSAIINPGGSASMQFALADDYEVYFTRDAPNVTG
jgi:hypothetical protein